MTPLLKILLRPVARAIDALLEKLHTQVISGEREEALKTINELRNAVKEGRKYLE